MHFIKLFIENYIQTLMCLIFLPLVDIQNKVLQNLDILCGSGSGGGPKLTRGSLKQGVWCTPEAISCLVFELSESNA